LQGAGSEAGSVGTGILEKGQKAIEKQKQKFSETLGL
jgi:hypothetical protein